MKPAKIAVVTLFLLMAIGGISGVMLAGYSFIVRGGVGLSLIHIYKTCAAFCLHFLKIQCLPFQQRIRNDTRLLF